MLIIEPETVFELFFIIFRNIFPDPDLNGIEIDLIFNLILMIEAAGDYPI